LPVLSQLGHSLAFCLFLSFSWEKKGEQKSSQPTPLLSFKLQQFKKLWRRHFILPTQREKEQSNSATAPLDRSLPSLPAISCGTFGYLSPARSGEHNFMQIAELCICSFYRCRNPPTPSSPPFTSSLRCSFLFVLYSFKFFSHGRRWRKGISRRGDNICTGRRSGQGEGKISKFRIFYVLASLYLLGDESEKTEEEERERERRGNP